MTRLLRAGIRLARRWGPRLAVVGLGLCLAVVSALPDLDPPVLVLVELMLLACAVTAAVPWRLAGNLTMLTATLAVLASGTLDDGRTALPRMVAGALLLVLLVRALGAGEDAATGSRTAVTVARPGWARMTLPALLAAGAGTGVAVTAAQDVVPSLPLVLVGLAATVGALVMAARGHRRA